MRSILHSSEFVPFLNLSLFPQAPYFLTTEPQPRVFFSIPKCSVYKPPLLPSRFCMNLLLGPAFTKFRKAHLRFCIRNDAVQNFESSLLPDKQETEELELLNKPSSRPLNNGSVDELVVTKLNSPDKDEVLEDFLKFFKQRDSSQEESGIEESSRTEKEKENDIVAMEYYEPKPGDSVVGVVVSGNENKVDVNVGADMLGTMLTKELLPLYEKEIDFLLCNVEKDSKELMTKGKMGIMNNDEAMHIESTRGRPVVEPGTVIFAEVLGRTLSGRPLLSTRRLFRRLAWYRVAQIKQLNEPILVKITEWNIGGLLTRIEGLRAFIPKIELVNRVNNYSDLKENVGRWLHVVITRMNEDTNELILSEKEAWGMIHLEPGTLLDGTVKKILPYGAQIRIGDTNRSGLIHISNISRGRIASVSDILAVDEKVKVLVIKSMFPDKISLSIADLESEPGLFLSNKEKVYAEAESMSKKYRSKMSDVSITKDTEPLLSTALHFEDEENSFANWKWFDIERNNESSTELLGLRAFVSNSNDTTKSE